MRTGVALVALIFVLGFAYYVPMVHQQHSGGAFYGPSMESISQRVAGEGAIFSMSRGYYICSSTECVRVAAPTLAFAALDL